jgi:apolipoprotein N-acyltransferase
VPHAKRCPRRCRLGVHGAPPAAKWPSLVGEMRSQRQAQQPPPSPGQPAGDGPGPAAPGETSQEGTATAGFAQWAADGAEADGAEADGAEADGAEADGAEADGAEADGAEADGAEADGAAAGTGQPTGTGTAGTGTAGTGTAGTGTAGTGTAGRLRANDGAEAGGRQPAGTATEGGGRPGGTGAMDGLRLRWALLAALAGGLALAAAFPPAGVWPLAAAGPALLVLALRGQGVRGSLAVGAVFGLAFFFPLLTWVINLAWYAWLALAAAETVLFAVVALGQRLLLRLPGWPVAVAGWWVAAEAFRDRWPWGGFPWGRLAMSQASAPTARWVSVGGAPLLTFLVALTGATLAWLILERRLIPALGFAAVAGVTLAGAALPVQMSSRVSSTVAAVQGDVPHARNLPALLNDTQVTQNHAAATEKLAAQVKAGRRPAPALVVWPENSTDLDPFRWAAIYQTLEGAVHAIGRPILVGEILDGPSYGPPVRNVGQLWLPGTGPGPEYVKRQLVPFGEYIPFRGLLSHITSLTTLQPYNMTPGHRAVVFRVGDIRLGDVICYEVGFDGLVRSEVAAGANLLSVQTNDATFEVDGQTGESLQQLAMARLRAIEFDRSVVVASTTGVSAIIAPDGRLITHSGTWQQAVLEARVPLLTSHTLAERVGSWPEYVITGLTVLAVIAAAAGAIGERRRPSAARR